MFGQSQSWIGNLSIGAFVYNLTKDGFGLFSGGPVAVAATKFRTHRNMLFGYFAICFFTIIVVPICERRTALNAYLL